MRSAEGGSKERERERERENGSRGKAADVSAGKHHEILNITSRNNHMQLLDEESWRETHRTHGGRQAHVCVCLLR